MKHQIARCLYGLSQSLFCPSHWIQVGRLRPFVFLRDGLNEEGGTARHFLPTTHWKFCVMDDTLFVFKWT